METYILKQVKERTLDFSELEQIIWRTTLNLFQHFIEKILVEIDKYLMVTRDKERYELKESKGRTIETLVGPVKVERRYYWDKREERWVYLLDEALKLEQYKVISPGLLKLAVTWATKGSSYRDYFIPRGRFPAISRGTEGYAVLFREILRFDSL